MPELIATEKIKEITQVFFDKMSVSVSDVQVSILPAQQQSDQGRIPIAAGETVEIDIDSTDPQFLIGQNGQTLLELQRILRILFCKKFQTNCYVAIDVNGYRKKKALYLKTLANTIADEVVAMKAKKILPPMSSYERRIVHAELAGRQDVISESQGEGLERRVVVSPVV